MSTVAASTPGRSDAASRGLVTMSVMLATIMQALDTTIANVALPNMQGGMGATQDQISWVLTSYIVAAAIMTPPTGILADRLGRRRLFLISIAGFTVASMLCGAAQTLPQIVFFRLLQGVFGAALVPLSQSVLLDTYPREQHGSAMAMWGVGVMVGPILGPTLGGWLTEYWSWRWVFYINLPFGILAFLGVAAFVTETSSRGRSFDVWGFALLSLAIGSFQMMLDRGELLDWFSSREIIVETVVAGLAFYLFLVHMFTAEHPFIDPHLFKDRNLSAGLVLIFLIGVILLATMALLPPFLQNLRGYPVITTGYLLAPRGVGTMVAMFLVGRLMGRIDARLLIVTGMGLVCVSLWEMTGFTMDVPAAAIVRSGIVQGFGLGLIFVPLSTLTFATLAPHFRTDATGLFSLMRNLGSSIGISIVMSYLSQSSQANHEILGEHINPFNPLLRSPWLPDSWDPETIEGLAGLNAEVSRQAMNLAYIQDFQLMMGVVILAAPLLLLLRKPARRA